jgi:hypothetical protein
MASMPGMCCFRHSLTASSMSSICWRISSETLKVIVCLGSFPVPLKTLGAQGVVTWPSESLGANCRAADRPLKPHVRNLHSFGLGRRRNRPSGQVAGCVGEESRHRC